MYQWVNGPRGQDLVSLDTGALLYNLEGRSSLVSLIN